MLPTISQELRFIPFARLLLYFISGIIFQISFQIEVSIIYFLPPIFISFVVFSTLKLKFQYQYIAGIAIFLLLFFLGIFCVQQHKTKDLKIRNKNTFYIAVVDNQPEEKENSFKLILKLKLQKTENKFIPISNKILCYLPKKKSKCTLEYGDEIIFSSKINPLTNPGNPNEFDYAKYLQQKGISGQAFLQEGKYKRIAKNQGKIYYSFAYKLRNKLINIYKNNNITGQNLAVLSALTLGDKSELSPETKQAYSASGAMHVLAVSGLHVGIIYVIITFLLKFMDRLSYKNFTYGIYLKALFIILFLWFFAFLSGLSPSVLRAALMFSFFVIGSLVKRPINIYNSLSASAFILLAFNPFFLFSVGFQMSYIAVFSIVYFQPKIYNSIYISNLYLDKIWILTSVSIAAQLGTAPISLYFFHQFPNWFILTNLAVIPIATVVVYLAVSLFAVSAIPGFALVSVWVAKLLNWTVSALNFSVTTVDNLPFAVTKNIIFRTEHLVLLYATLIIVFLFIRFKKGKLIKVMLLVLLVLNIFGISNTIISQNKSKFIVFNSSKETFCNFISGQENLVYGDTTLGNKIINYAANGFWLQQGMPNYRFIKHGKITSKLAEYFQFKGKRIGIINNKEAVNFTITNKIKLDYLVISNNPYISIDELTSLYDIGILVFDASNKKLRCERWREECDKINQPYFSVPNQGAFIASF